jgi:hypothetical protein
MGKVCHESAALASPGLPLRCAKPMDRAMAQRSPLDDPGKAAYAWARYRRLMRFMAAITLAVVVVAFAMLYQTDGLVSIHLYIAAALGIGFSMLLMSALMGLVFLSSGTGHDETLLDRGNDRDNRRPPQDL